MATALPSIPITGAVVYDVIHALGANVNMMTLCAMIPPVVGVISVYVMYLVGQGHRRKSRRLVLSTVHRIGAVNHRKNIARFLRHAGSRHDRLDTVRLLLPQIHRQQTISACIHPVLDQAAAATLAYFIAGWGGAYYMIDATVLFMFAMLLLKRYSQRLLVSYSITFGLALMIATKVPYMGLSYLTSGAVLPVAAGFVLLLIAELLRNNISLKKQINCSCRFAGCNRRGLSCAYWQLVSFTAADIPGNSRTVLRSIHQGFFTHHQLSS